jgi:hypothetical protein
MSKNRVPTTIEEFDQYIRNSTAYLLADSPPPEEEMLFEDGELMLFEDGEEMDMEG